MTSASNLSEGQHKEIMESYTPQTTSPPQLACLYRSKRLPHQCAYVLYSFLIMVATGRVMEPKTRVARLGLQLVRLFRALQLVDSLESLS